jgi:hypothetical protein
MIDRTLLRPRDLIAFFNHCIANAENDPKISASQLLQAEGTYSQLRMKSLCDEWSLHYPCLAAMSSLLKKKAASFRLGEIDDDQLLSLCLEVLDRGVQRQTEDIEQIRDYFDDKINSQAFRSFIAQVLYRVGLVGLKTDSYKEVIWSNNVLDIISFVDINDNTTVIIHKMFWRALGIKN